MQERKGRIIRDRKRMRQGASEEIEERQTKRYKCGKIKRSRVKNIEREVEQRKQKENKKRVKYRK